MDDFCNTQNIMQINVPVVPVNRYAVDDTDRLFSFGGCDLTELREHCSAARDQSNNVAFHYNLIYLVNLLRIKDKNRGCTLEELVSEATNPKLD